MQIRVGSNVVHNTLNFLSVGTVVKIHDDIGKKIIEVAWPNMPNGIHSEDNLSIFNYPEIVDIPSNGDCWY